MTLDAYRTLYESGIAFGMRKALAEEQGKNDMQKRVLAGDRLSYNVQIKDLDDEKEDLERQLAEMKAKCEAIEKREMERRVLDDKKHAEEVGQCSFMPCIRHTQLSLREPTHNLKLNSSQFQLQGNRLERNQLN